MNSVRSQVGPRLSRLSYLSSPSPRLCARLRCSSLPSFRGLTTVNPRHDSTGAPMSIAINPRAVSRLLDIQRSDNNSKLALRVTVESGGCHGFQYIMSLTDKIDPSEDTVFDEGGAKVVMDGPSLELLKGSKVDYTMELIGSQFKIVDNPYATSSCGCGTSFDVKE